jgi:hypothetical protein
MVHAASMDESTGSSTKAPLLGLELWSAIGGNVMRIKKGLAPWAALSCGPLFDPLVLVLGRFERRASFKVVTVGRV